MSINIKEMVTGDKQVYFLHYKDGELWYKHENGYKFPVPVSDVGTATMLNQDRAMFFMRYIRQHNAMLINAKAESDVKE